MNLRDISGCADRVVKVLCGLRLSGLLRAAPDEATVCCFVPEIGGNRIMVILIKERGISISTVLPVSVVPERRDQSVELLSLLNITSAETRYDLNEAGQFRVGTAQPGKLNELDGQKIESLIRRTLESSSRATRWFQEFQVSDESAMSMIQRINPNYFASPAACSAADDSAIQQETIMLMEDLA